MRQVIVELTDEEYSTVESLAMQLHLRGPSEWLRLAGLNFRISTGTTTAWKSTPEQATQSANSLREPLTLSRNRHFFHQISQRLSDALEHHPKALKEASARVAQAYHLGQIPNKQQFADEALWDLWREWLTNTNHFLAVLQHLSKRKNTSAHAEQTSERWPYRIAYSGLKDWLQHQFGMVTSLKKDAPNCFYWYLDFLRDAWVEFAQSAPGQGKYIETIDGVIAPGPHMLVVRVDNGQPGRGGFDLSPLLRQPPS